MLDPDAGKGSTKSRTGGPTSFACFAFRPCAGWGFLSDVARALTDKAALPDVIAKQIDELDAAIEHASSVRARLTRLQDLLAAGDVPASEDWLGALELATQYDRYCSASELSRILAHRKAHADEWPRLIADLREAQARLSADSADAQPLGTRWRRLALSQVGGDLALAIKLKLAYSEQPELQDRARVETGLDATVLAFINEIWRHSHMTLWAKHLDPQTRMRLCVTDERMRDWIRVVADMREAMNEGACAGGDPTLLSMMHDAFSSDPEQRRTWGLDEDLLAFVRCAREAGNRGTRI